MDEKRKRSLLSSKFPQNKLAFLFLQIGKQEL